MRRGAGIRPGLPQQVPTFQVPENSAASLSLLNSVSPPLQVYFWNHIDPAARGSFATLTVLDGVSGSGAIRRLQLSYTHYLPASQDPSGACGALAAAGLAGDECGAQAAWQLAAQVSAPCACQALQRSSRPATQSNLLTVGQASHAACTPGSKTTMPHATHHLPPPTPSACSAWTGRVTTS